MRLKFFLVLCAVVLSGVLSGCGFVREGQKVPITPSSRIIPLDPQSAKGPVEVQQLIHMGYGSKGYFINGQIDIVGNKLDLGLIDGLGRPLASLKQQGAVFQVNTLKGWPKNLDVRQIVVLMQILFWPYETVKPWLEKAGLFIEQEKVNGNILTAVIVNGRSVPIMHIERLLKNPWQGRAHLDNDETHLKLSVQSTQFKKSVKSLKSIKSVRESQ